MIKKLPWLEILVAAAALAVGGAVYLYAHRDQGALEESKRRGAEVVAALMTYEAQYGTYPETLDELVPEQLARVEPPTWGLQRWTYRRYTPAEVTGRATADADAVYFQLSVAAATGGYPVLYYDLAARRWVLNN